MNEPLLSLQQVSFFYADRSILSDVNFDLFPGERVVLLGANGAGKTTLMELLVGLKKPSSGRVVAFGEARRRESEFKEVRARAGFLFQDSDDQLFCPTVLEDVAFGPINLGQTREEALATAYATLGVLGLGELADRVTHKLSGGEKRLVSLATVLAMRPDVLLLDEPTTGLDESARQRLMEHLERLPQAMLIVSHDQGFIEHLATRAVLVRHQSLIPSVLHRHPHVHAHNHIHVHPVNEENRHDHEDPIVEHEAHASKT